jgi:hypothetical protein
LPLATTCHAMGGTNRVDIPPVGAEEGVAWMRLSLVLSLSFFGEPFGSLYKLIHFCINKVRGPKIEHGLEHP